MGGNMYELNVYYASLRQQILWKWYEWNNYEAGTDVWVTHLFFVCDIYQ